ncbi:hypothetical protein LSI01_18010 [Furfurilactobacillus siliginis]|uniref:Uncharacterized protein n=1 Tax=Furfurilactobacillus siliginis TaxID=348151 RepID=A0A510VXL2_9LACO|nr:hypothetical protein LSI01_18010 [Furfurilactobacillus siliginis]
MRDASKKGYYVYFSMVREFDETSPRKFVKQFCYDVVRTQTNLIFVRVVGFAKTGYIADERNNEQLRYPI